VLRRARSSADHAADAGAATDAGCARVKAAHANTLNGTADHISVTLDAVQNGGDFLVVGVNYVDCSSVQKVSDSAGNTYEGLLRGADLAHGCPNGSGAPPRPLRARWRSVDGITYRRWFWK
jgi:hypothetical protein